MIKVAILQSNYIPWKGVFDMISRVDVFVFLEDVDFTKRDWRTRNTIKVAGEKAWLSVPVKKAPRGTKISEIEINDDGKWQKKHKTAIELAYRKAPYFKDYAWVLDDIYAKTPLMLSEFNISVTKLLCDLVGVGAAFVNSADLDTSGVKDDKLIQICKKLDATSYLSGPAAKDYIEIEKFADAGITLEYMDYQYPVYPQLHGEFDHYVSVLDVIFNCGPNSKQFICS